MPPTDPSDPDLITATFVVTMTMRRERWAACYGDPGDIPEDPARQREDVLRELRGFVHRGTWLASAFLNPEINVRADGGAEGNGAGKLPPWTT